MPRKKNFKVRDQKKYLMKLRTMVNLQYPYAGFLNKKQKVVDGQQKWDYVPEGLRKLKVSRLNHQLVPGKVGI